MQSRLFKIIISLFLLFIGNVPSYAQLSVSGPQCIITGTEYQYNIIRNQADSSDMRVCITGGKIAGTDSTCRSGSGFSFIRVIWIDTSTGNISIHTLEDSASINVKMTIRLQGGQVDSASHFQMIKADSIPSSVFCSAATGGSCLPSNIYQWQKSLNGMNWNNIPGAVLQHLVFSAPISQNTYYRRKVTESASGSENISDVAVIIIAVTTSNP